MPIWNGHTYKRDRKGTTRQPLRGSEKAWVDKAWRTRHHDFKSDKHTYLEFVRYYRWYCHRSPLLSKVQGEIAQCEYPAMSIQYYSPLQRWIA